MTIKETLKRLIPHAFQRYGVLLYKHPASFFELSGMSERLNKLFETDAAEIEEFQRNKIKKIIEHAGKNVPYYQKLFNDNGIIYQNLSDLRSIPLLDKETIRRAGKNMVAVSEPSSSYYALNTGGSTGEPLEFLSSYAVGIVDSFHQEYQYRLMGYRNGDTIVAFDGSDIPENRRSQNIFYVRTGPHSIPYGKWSFSSLYLNENTAHLYLEQLSVLRPQIIRGYPSVINFLAWYIQERGIELPFSLKGIQLTSETAEEEQVRHIERVFSCKVSLQYGHTEACIFAFTKDEQQTYYCSPFYGFTEILDHAGKHVQEGECGEVTVTGFYNKAMPFIRYKTGDLAIYKAKENGITVLEQLSGRTQDIVLDPLGNPVYLTALIFGQHLYAFKNIKKWQLIQKMLGEVTIRIVKNNTFGQDDEHEIAAQFQKKAAIKVFFDYVDDIPVGRNGKYKFLIQEIKNR